MPKAEDINIEGIDFTTDKLNELLYIDKELWTTNIEGIEEFYSSFGERLPKELKQELKTLKNNFN